MHHTTAKTMGVHHVGLTVSDVHTTAAFFIAALGFSQVGERPSYPALFVSDGHTLITLWQSVSPANAIAFNRHHNIGLHHLALHTKQLDALYSQLLDHSNVEIEFPPEKLGESSTRHMMCSIPGGIRLELIQV